MDIFRISMIGLASHFMLDLCDGYVLLKDWASIFLTLVGWTNTPLVIA